MEVITTVEMCARLARFFFLKIGDKKRQKYVKLKTESVIVVLSLKKGFKKITWNFTVDF